jgi:hypothetical protein
MEKSRIENIFNECLERLLTGTDTVEQCLQRHPEQAKELEPLLRTAMSVNKAIDVQPSAELKARIRYKLQLKMAEASKPRRASWFSLQPRWALPVMAAMLVFVIGGGTFLAADSSMPGSPLYPIKLFTEDISLKLAGSDTEKAELALAFADRRLTEMNYMLEKGTSNTERVDIVSSNYIDNVSRVTEITYGGQVETMMAASAPEAAREAESSDSQAGATMTSPPSEEKGTQPPAVAPEITLSAPTPGTEDASLQSQATEADELTRMIEYYAFNHPKQLEKWLKDPGIPEQYKITIRRMLQDIENLKR